MTLRTSKEMSPERWRQRLFQKSWKCFEFTSLVYSRS